MKSNQPTSRRDFLKSAVVLPAAVAALPATAIAAPSAKDASKALPMRRLGRNGPEVTMLNIGGMMSAHNPQYLDLAWNMGIRYFDTADCYKNGKSEQDVGAWVNRYPERRKDVFIVTKDHPKKGPEELLTMIDRRLENMGIDYVDLFFIHGIGTKSYGKDSLDWPKSNRLKDVFDELKASGKVKYCGFSCHDKKLIEYLNAAAEGGFIDAIMLRYNPLMKSGDDLDRALDACHEAGIGLVAMKEMQAFKKAPVSHPSLEETGLSTHQVVLQAVWSDPRIASVCSSIENVQQMEQNTMAARVFKDPITPGTKEALGQIAGLTSAPMCPGCPSCNAWAEKTQYAFHDISRYVTYYESDGNTEARSYYRRLSDQERSPQDVDLAQIRDACQYNVDYPEIARRSEIYFA
jgi:aryl-alcohol dehydrogenase-like predicted oxidoreductase